MLIKSITIRTLLSVFIFTNTALLCPCSLHADECNMASGDIAEVESKCSSCPTQSDSNTPQSPSPCECNHDYASTYMAEAVQYTSITENNDFVFSLREQTSDEFSLVHESLNSIQNQISEKQPPISLYTLSCLSLT